MYFLDWDVIVELKLNAEFNFFSNYYLECIGVQTNFWNPIILVSICSHSYDQKNAVSCNSVIEEPSFRLENVVVRIYLSCSSFSSLLISAYKFTSGYGFIVLGSEYQFLIPVKTCVITLISRRSSE